MSCERPYVLFALLLIIPIILITFIKNRRNSVAVEKNFSIQGKNTRKKRLFKYGKMTRIKSALFITAWAMLILAYSKISWGTDLVPVQKNGSAVSFVFDISNSMLATDGPTGVTRLRAASIYAKKMIGKMKGIPVSVVLAKGDGVTAIPITEDYPMIESLLDVMSPSLMTSPGSSLGKGVLKAKESFPANYANAGHIWVFTDGEETDNHLKNALIECLKSGVPVTIIGFGSETETDILAGDGVTHVKSALRAQKIRDTIEGAVKNLSFFKNQTQVNYIDSLEKGSAVTLLSQISKNDVQTISYEEKPVPRYKFFLILAVILFAAGFVITEFDLSRFLPEVQHVTSIVLVLAGLSLFTGCSSNTTKMLKGAYAFNQKQYSHAVSCYLDVAADAREKNDWTVYNYSLFDLGTAYSKLEENEAAMEKYAQIGDNAPDAVRYAAYYNAGIIAHKNGRFEEATGFFRKALEIDSSSIEAKINMELSIQQTEVEVQESKAQAIPATDEKPDNPELENAVFETIKENDKKKWKSNDSTPEQSLAGDY